VQIGFMAFAVSAYVRSWLCPDLQSYSPQPMRLTAPVEKKRKDYTFRRQFNEKPSIIPGRPGTAPVRPGIAVNPGQCNAVLLKAPQDFT